MTKFCSQCGAQVTETQRFCNKCGTQLQTTQPTAASGYSAPTANFPNYEAPNYQTPPNYQQPGPPPGYGQMPYQPPYQQPYQPAAASGDLKPNIAGALCYPLSFVTGILFLVLTPYNKDRFVRFHAYQSIFFFAAILALNIALGILGIVLPWRLERVLDRAVDLLSFGGTLWLIYQAYRGEKFKMPFIGDLAETQADKL
jgi:uncharacterized membrane protein